MFLRGFVAGVFFVLAGIVAVGMFAKAFTCERSWVGVNTISHHLSPARKYNESNWGLFLECQRNEDWGYQLGYYRNSYERDTWYGLVTYQPWTLYGIRIGGMAGLGTGYREEEVDGKDIPRGGLSPLLAGLFSVEGRRLGANLIVGASVIGLQVKLAL